MMNTRSCCLAWVAVVSALCAVPAAAQVPDGGRGRLLYENHCVACHTSKVHRRTPAIPIDVQDLRRIVSSWAKEQNLRWTPQEVEDVVYYLDRTHYRLEK